MLMLQYLMFGKIDKLIHNVSICEKVETTTNDTNSDLVITSEKLKQYLLQHPLDSVSASR